MGPGWGCRDHAVVLAALLTSGGTDAQVVHGANVFIQGPTTDGQDPVGLGNDLAHGGEHTWVHVSAFGTVDVSLRLSERVQSWRPAGQWPHGNRLAGPRTHDASSRRQ